MARASRSSKVVFDLTGPATLFFAPKVVAGVLLDRVQGHLREQLQSAVPVPDVPPIPG